MIVDPGCKYVTKLARGISWYTMDPKDFMSTINFKLQNENNKLVLLNGQNVTFRLSINEI